MEKAARLDFTIAQEKLLSLFLAPTRDAGFTMGFTHPSFGGVKLTGYRSPRDGRIHVHLKTASGGRLLWSSQLDPAFLGPVLHRHFMRWFVPIEKLPAIYVPRPPIRRKLARFAPRMVDGRTTQIPIEALRMRVRSDFRNRRRWEKVAASEFIRRGIDEGYTVLFGSVRAVRSILGLPTHLLAIGERQFDRAETTVLRLMGFEAMFAYVEAMKLGEPVFRQGRRRVREIYGPKKQRSKRLPPV